LSSEKIGIVGGVGPYAGIDLYRKILDNTIVIYENDHISVTLISYPGLISDRSSFLLKSSNKNPAYDIVKIIKDFISIDINVIGIACNQVHAPQIFDVVLKEISYLDRKVKVLSIIEEVSLFLTNCFPSISKIGLLARTGTVRLGIYDKWLNANNIEVVVPDNYYQDLLDDSIANSDYGIKKYIDPFSKKAVKNIHIVSEHIKGKNPDALILGCTELPLVKDIFKNHLVVDPTLILARGLINEVNPAKLLPLTEI